MDIVYVCLKQVCAARTKYIMRKSTIAYMIKYVPTLYVNVTYRKAGLTL